MNKIFKTLSWYTFEQAARRLSATLDGVVTENEVIQLIIEDKVPVYWHLHAQGGVKAELHEGKRFEGEVEKLKENLRDKGFYNISTFFQNGPKQVPLNLNPVVREQLTARLLSQTSRVEGVGPLIVKDSDGNFWYVLDVCKYTKEQEDDPLYNPPILSMPYEPDYSALVILREDLERLENQLSEGSGKRQNDLSKENKTLSLMVYAMAVTKYGYDPEGKRNTATGKIADDLDLQGTTLSEDIILKHLRNGANYAKTMD